jgi:DNA-binding IclR family transcriptional regulator
MSPRTPSSTPTPDASRGDRNRSLERGMQILRAFRPGSDLLGNGELADRTGLSRATVSRLTQTLVHCGFLEHDPRHRAYRLAAPVLGLAHAMRSGSRVLNLAGPLIRSVAEQRRINIGLAVADGDEMVYLESVRYARRVAWRNVEAGQRVPMELTSLGRAYLATVDAAERRALMAQFKARRARDWNTLSREIAEAIASVHRIGHCATSWQPGVAAVATPIQVDHHPVYVLNMSTSAMASASDVAEELGTLLLDLAQRLHEGLAAL